MALLKWATIGTLVIGVLLTILGLVLGWYVFPNIVDSAIDENVVLKKGTEQFERFEDLPLALDFKVYVFHVKNTEDVNKGLAKPELEERGPYVYKQKRDKKDIVFSEENTRISYHEFQHYEFDDKASGEFTQEDEVTIVNPALNGAIQILQKAGLDFLLKLLNKRVKDTFNVDNIFITTSVREFLFGGHVICDLKKIAEDTKTTAQEKLEAKIVCLGLFLIPTKNIQVVKKEEDDVHLVFTFLGHKKDKHDGLYKINSGANDIQKTGLIEEWENKPYLTHWNGGNESTCNMVRGRDAVLFEPHLTENTVLTIFNTDICRTVDLRYKNDVEFRDVTAYEYELGADIFRSPREDKEEEMCYCLKASPGITADSGCLQDGMMELFTCYNAPILLSFPHFLWASKEYQDAIPGMKPDVVKHRTFAKIEPNTGTPLEGSKRVQFNMFVNGAKDKNGNTLIDLLKGFEEQSRLIPIIWLDEGIVINDELYGKLYDMYISKTYLIAGVTWGIIGVGIAVMVCSLVVYFILKNRSSKTTV